ncbi:type IV secretory system conjugative DNA transfer family protein [Brevundimonas sp.]|uniref:type IV secretory system conjugative DNA transfer family protein n=1 Tax=Brevundimonas sp. TaxID=1871086 RepID=UPI002D65B049|nr:type IV secretion system DNA-binding domain-containing protein [Brevundimonas sp.]HYC99550.1 type IV secretion system DNA-binding domain-containing protein [Brevundimonas sp.]
MSNFHGSKKRIGIAQADRLSHMYIIGKTGVGKSTLLEILLRQDIVAGRGFALIDPHGDLAERVWAWTPHALRDRITYLNAPDSTQPFGYNPLRRVRPERIPLAAAGLLETFRKQWPNAWGVRMEHVLRNALYALLERDDATLPDILRLFSDKKFRKSVARKIENPVVKEFWTTEFENYPARLRAEAVAPIQNKLGALLVDPTLFRILVAPASEIRLRALMDEGRGLIVNLSKGELGEDACMILGGLMVTTLGLAAFSRANVRPDQRRPFFIYADEFQSFTTLSLVNMMSELRKYGAALVLAHQHLNQLDPALRSGIFGNVGSLVAFRIGAEDAPCLANELISTYPSRDLVILPNQRVYLKLLIGGAPSQAFSSTISALESSS